ncbi:MAG: hypothetical protein HYX68_01930 [Planctomycetes bacterium]|jgi:hypothetical protein|nr:hypothetical protein [Planctomycetota bacterium]
MRGAGFFDRGVDFDISRRRTSSSCVQHVGGSSAKKFFLNFVAFMKLIAYYFFKFMRNSPRPEQTMTKNSNGHPSGTSSNLRHSERGLLGYRNDELKLVDPQGLRIKTCQGSEKIRNRLALFS